MIEKLFGRAVTTIRIPLSGSVPIPKAIKQIIETPPWQRLLGVLQLSFAYNVYPGATHTRAEHSLGVFALLSHYLERLRLCPGFTFSEEELREVLVAGLLHDIGQGPFSHWMDELAEAGLVSLPTHEERAEELLSEGELGRVLRRQGLRPERIAALIRGEGPLGKLLAAELDADRMDYLPRDSLHTGVPYGMGFDTERLLMALWWEGGVERGYLAITPKGLHPLKVFFSGYEIMYEAVYLHKTVHALSLMMREAIMRMVFHGKISPKEIKSASRMTDWEFLAFLQKKTEKESGPIRELLAPFLQKKRRIVKLVAEMEVAEEKLKEMVSKYQKELSENGHRTVLVGGVFKRMPDMKNISVVDPYKETPPRSLSSLARFVPSGPISLLRIYAFEQDARSVKEALSEIL